VPGPPYAFGSLKRPRQKKRKQVGIGRTISASLCRSKPTQCSRIDLCCLVTSYDTYHPKHTCPKSMAWLLTQVDPSTIFAWCTLTGDIGKPLMALVGFSGLISTARALWTLPAVTDSHIVTLRNKQRRYRNKTIIVGWCALLLFSISIVLYFYSVSRLAAIGRVCEMDHSPHAAAMATLPFLLTTMLALFFFVWLQTRALNLKDR
jgi:hypothetical protein